MRALQRVIFASVVATGVALAAAPGLAQAQEKFPRILDLPDVKERLQSMGFYLEPTTPEEYDKILRRQIESLSRVARDAGLFAK
jgi:tripartite-type tricarboxylate transporter receptor subunit TctC